jgi:hypothetical protein
MGYAHIKNLYQDKTVLLFKEVWATEKIHGTTAWILYDQDLYPDTLHYHHGGGPREHFIPLFDERRIYEYLKENFGNKHIRLHGEYYGGKINKQRHRYGDYGFILFEIRVGDVFLSFDKVQIIGGKLGLDVVDGVIVPATVEALDRERDRPSVLAMKRGIGDTIEREGIVIHPLIELTKNNGERVIAKHKGERFMETATPRDISPEKLLVLEEAEAIAFEWVTPMRLEHVLDAFPDAELKELPFIIRAMQDDIIKESIGEIKWPDGGMKAVSRRTVELFKDWMRTRGDTQ